MGVYRKYTITRNVPLPVTFKCKSCGKDNILLNPFALEASYNDKGTFSQSAVKDRERSAQAYLDSQQAELYARVSSATRGGRFRKAGYVCKCAHCGRLPAWSNYPVKLVDGISVVAIFFSIIMALIWLKSLLDEPLPASELMPALKVLIYGNLPAIIVYTIKWIRVKVMGKAYLPMVFKDANELQQHLQKAAAQASAPAAREPLTSLIAKGYVETSRHRTPHGGDYSEAHYLDKDHNYTSKEKASVMIIRELKDDGTLVQETFMHRK